VKTGRVFNILCNDEMASREHIELVILSVKLTELDPEDQATHSGEDAHGAVIPDKERVGGEGDEGLSESGRDGGHEKSESLDERAHVAGSFGEGILEGGDGGKDLGDGD